VASLARSRHGCAPHRAPRRVVWASGVRSPSHAAGD
jgi:hypothetical protein